jgi:hypothetical protein
MTNKRNKIMEKDLEYYKEKMECNGYAYFDNDAFLNEATKICYIPENAETIDDAFTYLDLRHEVEEWAEKNSAYIIEHDTDIGSILKSMYENLSWEFPSTYLDGLDY